MSRLDAWRTSSLLLGLLLALSPAWVGVGLPAWAQSESPIAVLATLRPHCYATHDWPPANNAESYEVRAEIFADGEWRAWRRAQKRVYPTVSNEYLMGSQFRIAACAVRGEEIKCGEQSDSFACVEPVVAIQRCHTLTVQAHNGEVVTQCE